MEDESVLIFKRKGKRTEVKVTKKMRGRYTPDNCSRVVNLKNYKDLALFLLDLQTLWSAPVDKAIVEYKRKKEEGDWLF